MEKLYYPGLVAAYVGVCLVNGLGFAFLGLWWLALLLVGAAIFGAVREFLVP